MPGALGTIKAELAGRPGAVEMLKPITRVPHRHKICMRGLPEPREA
jgi:hypothetical protein